MILNVDIIINSILEEETAANPPAPQLAQPFLVPVILEEVTARSKTRGSKFIDDELHFFLNIMLDILPIGPTEWEQVVDQHSVSYPSRHVNTLRRKYTPLQRKKIPTGDLNMTNKVRMVKQCKYCILDKAELGHDWLLQHDAGEWQVWR